MDQIKWLSIRLEIERENGEQESIGSGVIWNPKDSIFSYIFTAAHVVDDYMNDKLIFNARYYNVDGEESVVKLDKDNIVIHREYKKRDCSKLREVNDIAVIKCEGINSKKIDFKISSSTEIIKDKGLVLYGFPKKLENTELSINMNEYTGKFHNMINEKEAFKYKLDVENSLDVAMKNEDLIGISGSGLFLYDEDSISLVGIHTHGVGKDTTMNMVIGMNIELVLDICINIGWDKPELVPCCVVRYIDSESNVYPSVKSKTFQISSIQEFISEYDSNETSAPLETNFQFRDREIKELISSIENNKVTVVFGKSGVGKTRIVVEVIKKLYEEDKYNILCIRSKDLPIYEDLMINVSIPGNYLIFIDDANELIGLKHVLYYLNMYNRGYNIKIIMTVRDYAKKYIMSQVKEFTIPKSIEIDSFSNDEIKKFIEENLGIKNELYLNQIANISEGNPRIAFLAGRLAKDNQSLISIKDVSQLYEIYYGRYINDSIISKDEKICLSAGIIAILNTINLEDLDKIQELLSLVDIDKDKFINNLKLLHDMEFISIHFDKVAEISDQCLSNYMIYYIFFEKKLISFSEILDIGFRYFRNGIIKSISILLNIFNSEYTRKYIYDQVNIIWTIYEEKDEKIFFEFLKVFHSFKPIESLIYIENKINLMEVEEIDLLKINFEKDRSYEDDDILSVLGGFKYSEYVSEAIELILTYCKKCQNLVIKASNILINNYGINHESYRNDYYTVNIMTKTLSHNCNDNELIERLFIRISEKLLPLSMSSTEITNNKTINMYTFAIELTDGSKQYRDILWRKLIELSVKDKYKCSILGIVLNYSNNLYKEVDSKVLEFDLHYIEELFENIKSVNSLEVAKLSSRIIEKCKNNQIETNSKFKNITKYNDEYYVYLMLSERHHKNGVSYEESMQIRKDNIKSYAESLDINSLEQNVTIFNNIVKQLPNEEWCINDGVDTFLDSLSYDKVKYLKFVELYIEKGENLNVYSRPIIKQLFYFMGVDDTFEFINSNEFTQKNEWEFVFFESLELDVLNNHWSNAFLEYLEKDSDKDITKSSYRNLKFLDKYTTVDLDIYTKATRVINNKFKYSPFISSIYLHLFFNENVFKPYELLNIFRNDLDLLQEIYFKLIVDDNHIDYSGIYIKTFIELDNSWIEHYIEYIINNINDMRYDTCDRISECWLSEDYKSIFDKIFYELENKDCIYKWKLKSFFSKVLCYEDKESDKYSNQLSWLNSIISDNCNNDKIICIFEIISELNEDIRIKCILQFLKLNSDYTMFEKLELEANHWGGMGSMIPYMEQRIKFYESLSPHVTGIKMLQHRKLILQKIDMWKRRIEKEQIDEIIEEKYN